MFWISSSVALINLEYGPCPYTKDIICKLQIVMIIIDNSNQEATIRTYVGLQQCNVSFIQSYKSLYEISLSNCFKHLFD